MMEQRTLQLLEYPKVLQKLEDFAVSEPGKAACLALRPMDDPDAMAQASEFLGQGLSFVNETGLKLTDFPLLDGLLQGLERPTIPLARDARWAILQVLNLAKSTLRHFSSDESKESRWPLLDLWAVKVRWPGKTFSGLNRCINAEGRLKDESSPELFQIRAEIRRIHQLCTKKVKDFITKNNLGDVLQDEYMTISSDRYVVPLKTNFKGRFPGIIHDYSQTGETCYFEPMFLVDINNQLQELKHDEREAERQVFIFLTDLARNDLPALSGVYHFLVELDLLHAKTRFAAALDGRPAEFNDGQPLRLLKARHPLLALASSEEVVPVDLELGEGQRGLIISGGNAGGKTVCLKTLGLLALMAASGLPLPVAEGGSLPAWTRIFVSIGDEQSLEDNVSTFTAQIHHLSRVFGQVDRHSLVILDEFGAGTDPSQGAALAQALVDSLLDRGAHVAAATHFPALKAYALGREGVRAASVLFDPLTKRPLFRLAYDQVGASHALDVAREHGLPEEILQRAQQYLLLEGSDTSSLMDRLNSLAGERDREIRRLNEERAKLEQKRRSLADQFERERGRLLEELKAQSQAILRQWREQQLSHKQAMKELAKTREQLAGAQEEKPEPQNLAGLAPGQIVLYRPWGKQAVVEAVDEKRGQVKVDMKGVTMWARTDDLASAEAPAQTASPAPRTPAGRSKSLTLDLRGHRVDTALSELEQFLDRALLDNFEHLEIIHGRGTGALRQEVHKFLRDFPAVQSYSLAPEDQGGDGMTMVELK